MKILRWVLVVVVTAWVVGFAVDLISAARPDPVTDCLNAGGTWWDGECKMVSP